MPNQNLNMYMNHKSDQKQVESPNAWHSTDEENIPSEVKREKECSEYFSKEPEHNSIREPQKLGISSIKYYKDLPESGNLESDSQVIIKSIASHCLFKHDIDPSSKDEIQKVDESNENVILDVKEESISNNSCDESKYKFATYDFENNSFKESQEQKILETKFEELSEQVKVEDLSQLNVLSTYDSQTSSDASQCAVKNDFDLNSQSSSNEIASPPAPSKAKLRNTKRRAGILYKKLTSTKLSKVTSKYFSQVHNNNKKRWIPPRSPYALVQEDLFDNPWQLLIATVFLTKTAAKRALPQLHKFLARYPRPEDILKANYEDIDEYFKPLGLTTTRSHVIMRFTVEFLEKDWTYPRELYGIGKYGDDSYRMFCINEWRQVSPDDIPLTKYRNWLLENAERLGLD
ncbi:methyl-CpG-binding domain protein 4-like isoform X2 [Macrosteles quadrilineatus]|nr:methyl-CpG-binding domain protein 4-like isoform X2 [Macrosteles quadrilineatus]XP_054280277.1 methyl-CpG-binding domain protein 4-like isoform X2 [Macrosteles quadrilineatus]XP_054280278.1 methyl-CpG-binding domain protein 4-like isoform X2 [Macrosteles quadrilineatus]